MATKQEFMAYCARHRLTFLTRDALNALFGPEEWEDDVVMVGFYDDPTLGAGATLLRQDGTVEVCKVFADGIRRMEDVWAQVTDDEMGLGVPLHATA